MLRVKYPFCLDKLVRISIPGTLLLLGKNGGKKRVNPIYCLCSYRRRVKQPLSLCSKSLCMTVEDFLESKMGRLFSRGENTYMLKPHEPREAQGGNKSWGKFKILLNKMFSKLDIEDLFIEGFPCPLLLSFVFPVLKPHFHPYHKFWVWHLYYFGSDIL